MEEIDSGMVTIARERHPEKLQHSMRVKDEGIFSALKDLQPKKAMLPSVVTVSGRLTLPGGVSCVWIELCLCV